MKQYISHLPVKLILLFSIFYSVETKAQAGFETQITLSRFDKFHQVGYLHRFSNFEIRTGLGYGIVKTAFQNKFFPQFYIGGSYDFLKSEKWTVGPTLYYSFSLFTFNRSNLIKKDLGKAMYHDVFAGIQFFYGSKLKVGFRALTGPVWQIQKSTGEKAVDTNKNCTLNYSAEISLRYVL